MDERLKLLRKSEGLTQKKFGERLKIKQNTIASYELGRNEPIDAVITLICDRFNVNETWLRTGEGQMYRESLRDEEVFRFFGDAFHGDDAFKKAFLTALSKLGPDEWELIERFMWTVIENTKSGS